MISFKHKILSLLQNERLFRILSGGIASLTAMIILVIVIFLGLEASAILKEVGGSPFIHSPSWHPIEGYYNILPMLAGTVFVTLGSVILATPLGIGSGIFCQYYAPPQLSFGYRRLIELLTGIPSVVYGFWGLVVLVPFINQIHPPGTSLLAGMIILALMILPTIALTTLTSLQQVSPEIIAGGFALGSPLWFVIWHLILPSARAGIITGSILATMRAMGETMAVLMVCGNVVQVPASWFDPVRTLTANIALEMAYATGNHRSALFVSGLGLMMAIALLIIGVELMKSAMSH